jgi:hypothetical protein
MSESDGRLMLGGDDLSAIDRRNHDLQWSTRVPTGAQAPQPLETPSQFAYFTPRGVFIVSKSSGDVQGVFRGSDLESLGGIVLSTANGLVTVSNLAATAYGKPAGGASAAK